MRIAHFSDPHVTADPRRIRWRDLLGKRLIGWANLRFAGRFRSLRDAARVARALCRDLAEQRPDHIVATGDFTGLALPQEFEASRNSLAALLDGDLDVTSIPGNHDVYVGDAVGDSLYEKWFGPWIRTDLQPHELPLAHQSAYPYPLLRKLGDDVALLCLNDSRPAAWYDSSGEVPASQLAALAHLLERADIRERTKILALHYGLRRADGSPDGRLHGLHNADAVLELVDSHDIALVLHGHLHGRFVHPAGAVCGAAIANPGSLTFTGRAMAYHVYTLQRGEIRLEARRYDAARDAFAPWPEAPGSGTIT